MAVAVTVFKSFLSLFCLKILFGCALAGLSEDLQSLNNGDTSEETVDLNTLKLIRAHDRESTEDIQVRHLDGGLNEPEKETSNIPKAPKRLRNWDLKDKRRKRSIDLDDVRSLRVNPDITPPPEISNKPDNLTSSLRELGIEKEVQDIVELVNKASAMALSVARARYCNNSKPALREQPTPAASPSDLLGIIAKVHQYAQSMVTHALANLTEFCEVSQSIEVYQRARASCPFYDQSRCVQRNFKSTKSGPVKYSTQHRPIIKQSTKHRGAYKVQHFVPLQRAREDNETDALEAESVVTEAMVSKVTEEGKTEKAGETAEPVVLTGVVGSKAAGGARRKRAAKDVDIKLEPIEEKKKESTTEKKLQEDSKEVTPMEKSKESESEKKGELIDKKDTETGNAIVNQGIGIKEKNAEEKEAKEEEKKALRLSTVFPTSKPRDYAPDHRRLSVRKEKKSKQRDRTLDELVENEAVPLRAPPPTAPAAAEENEKDPDVQEVPEDGSPAESEEIETEFVPRKVELTKKNKSFYDDRIWPGGYVYYMLKEDTSYDLEDVRRRLKAVNDILKVKTCVQLKEIRESEANKYEDYLVLDTSPDYVTGRVGGRQQFGVVELYEGGQHVQHAAMVAMAMLGFYFEVSRHDRDKFIRVHQRHVRADKLHHFEKIRSDATLHLPYDFKSGSHPAWQFWRHIGKTGISTVATLKEKDPDGSVMRSLGQHKQLLSELDLVKINSVYGTKCFKMARRFVET